MILDQAGEAGEILMDEWRMGGWRIAEWMDAGLSVVDEIVQSACNSHPLKYHPSMYAIPDHPPKDTCHRLEYW